MAKPPASPRLIAIDLDGTLLCSDGSVSARTRSALSGAVEAGIELVVVTGRPARHVRAIEGAEHLGDLAICLNGALVYDLGRHAVVDETRVPAAVAHDLIARLRGGLPGICFAVEVGLDHGWEPEYGRQRGRLEASQLPPADALILCERGVNKLIAFHPNVSPEELFVSSRDLVGDGASATYSGAPFLEISAREASKGSALIGYCAARAIDRSQVVALGDMPNDLSMLAWAGRGVAMANAHPTVLAAATEVTRSNDEDGVALVIERLLADTNEERPGSDRAVAGQSR
jgi:hydroxymethylpyrimidine pyrophosphatase-like HAD family hydrolase